MWTIKKLQSFKQIFRLLFKTSFCWKINFDKVFAEANSSIIHLVTILGNTILEHNVVHNRHSVYFVGCKNNI